MQDLYPLGSSVVFLYCQGVCGWIRLVSLGVLPEDGVICVDMACFLFFCPIKS